MTASESDRLAGATAASESPLYEQEVRDLLSIIDALNKPMSTDQPKTGLLYIDAMEVTVGMNDGQNDLFTVWWDGEAECFRVERKPQKADPEAP